ncbi:MAG TPA: hypothetical protein VHW91_05490 [Candidatus Dormibacteraeota bacterium]|nr:hypothetical protein [Candidatus Dormibacteraeota bacterium]
MEGRWRWPAIAAVMLMLLTVPPIAIAAVRTPPLAVFSGYVVVARDAYVYQALWRQGWHGAWLFHSPYSAEWLPGILLYPWYLWPAHILGWIPGPWLYHVERLAAAAALLTALWLLTAELFRPRLIRRWAMVLCSLGGGIGVLLPQLTLGPLVFRASEMQSPGSSVADLVAMAPHLPWAMALMCWAFVVGLRLRRRLLFSELISGWLAVIGLQLVYPQLALLAVGVLGGWALINSERRALRYAAASGALQLPYLGYLWWTWRITPDTFSVVRTSLDVGDPVGFLVLSHLGASALIVVALWRRRLRGDLLLPALWIAGMTLFMFAPGLSRTLGRSFMASSIPFGLCATPGLLSLLRGIRAMPWRRRVAAFALGVSSLYGVFSLAQPYWIGALRLDSRAEYESRAEALILQRLQPLVSARDVVLTTYLDGIFVPAQTDARAFAGHPEMTIDAARKAAEANAFFSSWTEAQRITFLRANHIDYVLAPDAAASARLQADPSLRRVDQTAGLALFMVRP